MNLINAVSNVQLHCIKCGFKSSCPGSRHTFSMSGIEPSGLINCSMKYMKSYESWKALFLKKTQNTHLKLMCKQHHLQALLCHNSSTSALCVFRSQTIRQRRAEVWRMFMRQLLQWSVDMLLHMQWASVGNILRFYLSIMIIKFKKKRPQLQLTMCER